MSQNKIQKSLLRANLFFSRDRSIWVYEFFTPMLTYYKKNRKIFQTKAVYKQKTYCLRIPVPIQKCMTELYFEKGQNHCIQAHNASNEIVKRRESAISLCSEHTVTMRSSILPLASLCQAHWFHCYYRSKWQLLYILRVLLAFGKCVRHEHR